MIDFIAADIISESGCDTERAAVCKKIEYSNKPVVVELFEPKSGKDDLSFRKRLLSLET